MKNLLFAAMALVLFAFNGNAINIFSLDKSNSTFENSLKKKHFEGDIVLSGGCKIHYVIDIDYSLFPPAVNSISGSLTMSGPCSGTQTFRASAITDSKGTITSVETDLKDKNLQTEEFNEAFAKSLNELKIFN